ncbi:hypothetical protein Acy02nite_62540 [Actinoplanes cyaneus]|uniref:DUF4352 domain-containing protein n=1 Tax=Actinoplanes cyaneus TaxID=52696 RepID=A0A919IN41_9ACTN|nr:hypothetical protein [Actinoplanes cyaneus]MCW2141547.1 hypothetical protein [Actinoplanes cyaneus]GID68373.1 hypothetical protein Acy02nite_62540 [Actinoplanes cyaneus]
MPDGNRFDAHAEGRARVYGSGGDMSIDQSRHRSNVDQSRHHANSGYQFGNGNSIGSHNNFGRQHIREQHIGDRFDVDLDPAGPLFTGRGPGRVLMILGLCVVGFSFAGWMSIVFGAMSGGIKGPPDMLGARLGSGIPVGAVYFLGVGFGSVLMIIGRSMAKAGAKGGSHAGHLVSTVIVTLIGVLGVGYALGGSSPAKLVPSFSGAAGAADAGPPVVVSDTAISAKRSGLSLTVTRIENTGGHGVVHLQARNTTEYSMSLTPGWFVVTDGDGRTYQPDHFGGDWNTELGPSARQSGTIALEKPVALGTGKLRVEFTTVIGRSGPDSIAVTAIPSH